MVDFNKRVRNSAKFRQAAIFFEKHGCYTLAPRGTTDYIQYWEQETQRCLNGYVAPDGDEITGYHYFYLNYSPIMLLKELEYIDRHGQKRTRRERTLGFPRFYDYDYHYFNAIQDAEDAGKHMAVLKARLKGYEQPYSELIATPNGFVEMGSLLVGDEIWNPDGNTTKVLEIYEQGVKDVYRVTLADGRSVRCGANHLWEVICANNHQKRKVITTHDLLNNGLFNLCTINGKQYNCYKYYLPQIDPVQYSEKKQNIPAYTLGALLGDGALTKKTPKISSIDNEILDRILLELGDGFEFKYDPTTSCEYRIVDKERFEHKTEFINGQYGVNRLHRWLEELNLCVSCQEKYIPDNYKYGSVQQRFDLIRGLMDTDGYVAKDGSMSFVNTSKQLIDDFVEVLRSLGIACTVSTRSPQNGGIYNNRAIFGKKFAYVVYIKGNPDIVYLSRKRSRIRFDRKFSNKCAIVNIEYLGEQEKQRCILVDNPNHLYLTRDYIPTHNSFKGASMLVRNYELIPGSKNFAVASEQKFLIGDGLLTKAWLIMDFCDKHTAWAKQRLTSTRMERVSGFKITDEFGKSTEQGYLSSITGITLKNDPERIRGTRGKLILWEEGGKFPNLLTAWRIELPAVETDDGVAFGLQVAFGCVCAGTKVWTSTGDCVKIEDLHKELGIVGWDTYQAVLQKIENMNPPAKKSCVRITTTTGRILECSTDHPLLWSKSGLTKRVPGKRSENAYMKQWKFHAAGLCEVGEQVGVIDTIPFFGTKKMWEPRVVGWLIGDGSYGYDKTPRLSNCDDEINSYIESNFLTAKDRPDRVTKTGKIYKETRIKGICPKLRELGIYGQTKTSKRLPLNIHQYDAESLSELIGGLFDTDGYIAVDKSGRPRITLAQCQREILEEVSEVLLHFGIHGTISFIASANRVHESNGKIIKDGKGYWRLSINDITSIGNFAKYISCAVAYKQSALDLMMLFTQEHLAQYNKYVLGVHAERIVKIEDIGERPIYNLTASGNHNYIANGIVTHNTGGTEGCLTAGNKVYTADGRRINIEDIELSDGIIGYDTVSLMPIANAISHINTPILKNCVRITTKQYRDIMCSDDHPIYASNRYDNNKCRVWEWIDSGALKPGDLVAISQDISAFGNENIFDPYLVGLLIGDGTYGGTSPYIFNADNEIISYIEKNYDCVDVKKQHITKDGRMFRALRIRKIIGNLKELGILGQTGINKRLPEKIFSCTKDDCCNMLAGLFDTDGCIRIGNSYGNRLPSVSAVFTTVSLNLAKDVRDLLLKIGIHASIQKKKQCGRNRKIRDVNPYYNVEIVDKVSLLNLYKNVNVRVVHKKAALCTIAEICKNKKRWYKNDFLYETVECVENIGLQTVYNLTADDTNTYIANGIITHNSSFDGLKDLFYKPDAYNILSFPNIWDDNAENTKCGFFVPSWSNMESYDENGKLRFMDKDGNTYKEKAIEELIHQRNVIKDGGATLQSIDRFISERPIKPQEAVLELGKNIFPRKLLMDQLTRIRTNTKLLSMKHIVDLSWDGDGKVMATEKKSGDITTYHLKKDDKPEGSVVIWEYPIDDPPFGLYIAGADPYDHDQSFTNSLGSTFIFKRVKAGEAWNDVLVAEYSGRPDTAELYYENVRKLLTLYNARLLFENERKGIYPYFTNKHCDYLLADQPDKVITEIFKDSKVQRRKGCHMTKLIRAYGEGLILEWLLEEFEPGHPNVERIYSEPLLEELIENDGIKNVDRVIALCMVMLYREELFQVKIAKNKEENKLVELFDMPLFGSNWWNDSEDILSSIPTFTF